MDNITADEDSPSDLSDNQSLAVEYLKQYYKEHGERQTRLFLDRMPRHLNREEEVILAKVVAPETMRGVARRQALKTGLTALFGSSAVFSAANALKEKARADKERNLKKKFKATKRAEQYAVAAAITGVVTYLQLSAKQPPDKELVRLRMDPEFRQCEGLLLEELGEKLNEKSNSLLARDR